MFDIALQKSVGNFTLKTAFTSGDGLTALFGPSGAGKSLMAQMLGGLVTPDAGHIRINDRLLFDAKKGINIPPHQRRIGFIFQEHRLFPHYSVKGNLIYGRKGTQGTVPFDTVIDILGIAHLLDRRPAALSGGERQRVAIGRALLSNPKVLVMDEPLSSLDAARKKEILPLIERLKSEFGITTLYISHAIEEITRLADHLLLIDRGELKGSGPVAGILSRLDLIPYTGGYDAGSLIEAAMRRYDADFHMSELEAPGGGRLFLTGEAAKVGETVRLRIRARDVALSLDPPGALSILNRFKGRITDHCSGAAGMEELLIDAGFPLAARVTRKSFEEMGLKEGAEVWALVKSVTINPF